MSETGDKPAIIGCGLSGMVISDQLAQADIPHVLVGDPPGDQPRLGESTDPAGTLELLELYPEFDEFYYNKRWISVFLGDYATACNFGQKLVRQVGLRMMGFESPPEFIHVDRVGFDEALYERVVASEYCTRIDAHVDTIEYDGQTDSIETVHLEGEESLSPEYVFDCTNHARVVGRALDIPIDWLSDPQQVVFTDYHAPADTPTAQLFDDAWKHGTNLVRLYADMDGLDGLTWAIPLGSYISVGISMPLEQDTPGEDEVLARVEDAFRRRGMDFLDVFSDPEPAVTVPRQQYFIHDRAYGQNWLLVGPSYGQVWFPSGSGVGTSLLAGHLAPRILERPEEAGREYQEYMDGLRTTHHVFDRMITQDYEAMTEEVVRSASNQIIAENVKRVARMASIQKGPLASGAARLFTKAVSRDGVAQGDCEVYEADPAHQTQTIFEHE